jgi:hypothetical protein
MLVHSSHYISDKKNNREIMINEGLHLKNIHKLTPNLSIFYCQIYTIGLNTIFSTYINIWNF